MLTVLFAIGSVYLGALAGNALGFPAKNFIRPKGLWKLVPLRVSGRRSRVDPRKVYLCKWVWEMDFDSYYIEEAE